MGYFCRHCGSDFENQFGFNPYYDEWTCEECGYENEISDDMFCSSNRGYLSDSFADEEDSSDSDDSFLGALGGAILGGVALYAGYKAIRYFSKRNKPSGYDDIDRF